MNEVSKEKITDIDIFNMALARLGFEPINKKSTGLEKALYDDLFPVIKSVLLESYWDSDDDLFRELIVLKTAMELCIPLNCHQEQFLSLKKKYEELKETYHNRTVREQQWKGIL